MLGGGFFAELAATAMLAIALAWVCLSDLRHYRIPDRASLPLLATGLCLSFILGVTAPSEALLGAAAGYCVFRVIGAIHFRMRGVEGLGLGDAKLLGAAGAWLGWQPLAGLVAGASLSALAFAVITGQRRLAFGPWLAGAFWLIWVGRISA